MMTEDQKAAYTIAKLYNFMPAHAVYPARTRNINHGKYEPDYDEEAETQCIILAHYSGGTNILIQYIPDDLEDEFNI